MSPQQCPFDLLKELVHCRNKAEQMRTLAETSHGEPRRIYLRLAQSYEECAHQIEDLKRTLRQTAPHH